MNANVRIWPWHLGHVKGSACGLMNGIVWDRHRRKPLLVKGVAKKVVRHSVEIQGDMEKHVETDQIKIVIHAFTRKGQMLTIE